MEVREVVWTESARDDLGSFFDFIAKDSPLNADRVVDAIVAKSDVLVTHAFVGTPLIFRDVKLRQIIVKNYRLIYCVTGDRVVIVAVIHSARELRRILKQRFS